MSKIASTGQIAQWNKENRVTEAKNQIGDGVRSVLVGIPAAVGISWQIFDENRTPRSFFSSKTIPVGLQLIGTGLSDIVSGLTNLVKA